MKSQAAIDQLLSQGVESGVVPGVVATAAGPDAVLYEGAFGRSRTDGDQSMTIDSVFRIASMTKAVACVAVMQLVEQGKLRLDEPAGSYAPRLASPNVLEGFDEQGVPRLRPARRPITLRHLLSHTSGLTYEIWNADTNRYARGQAGSVPADSSGPSVQPLAFDPGERWEYGIGIDWAGRIVELASGLSLEDYFQRHIFAPLGMIDTTFVLRPEQLPRLPEMHHRLPDGTHSVNPVTMPDPPTFFNGGGGLFSTGRDYLRFTRMLLRGGELDGERVLSAASVAELGRNQLGEICVTPFVTAAPALSHSGELFPGLRKKWGLGYMIIDEDAPTGRRAGSLSWAGLFNTYYWIDPTRQLTGLIMTQILPFLDPGVLALSDAFESAVYGAG
ncbi:MAG: serine hydrolase domain-containing protein [Dehalococcoidia bacterium]